MEILKIVETLSLLALAVTAVRYFFMYRSNSQKQEIMEFATALVEEGIAYSEEKNKFNKVEAAHNSGNALKKQPVEVTKDPIQSTKFFQAGMDPIRQIAHTNAKEYILVAIKNMKDRKMANEMTRVLIPSIDEAIKMRIISAKLGITESIKPLIYRNT